MNEQTNKQAKKFWQENHSMTNMTEEWLCNFGDIKESIHFTNMPTMYSGHQFSCFGHMKDICMFMDIHNNGAQDD